MVWNYINFAAMVVGYITIAVVLLAILAFIALSMKERYDDWKWKKQKEKEKAVEVKLEQPKEAVKDAAQDKPNVEISLK